MKFQVTKGELLGYVPSGKLTKYHTTYTHKDGSVTSKTWGTFDVTTWQPYTFASKPANQVSLEMKATCQAGSC